MKHQVRKPRNSRVYIYMRDGKDMGCPRGDGTENCASWCPFFDLRESVGGYRLTLSCVLKQRRIALDKEAPIVESEV